MGICRQNDVVYLSVSDLSQLHDGIDTLLNIESDRPVLLEVFTDPTTDEAVYREYYKFILDIRTKDHN